ncbi:hypothetical protein Hamer_G003285 [Homarus americanus]|uniref:Uncharacterized protein n=1 Tax=Homarus americanus TaxID=6706 RepID=A0A8J5TG48_HOMAM|nr:hypothetical protein Hamer_G003285 [Homarus americanus]
MDHSSSPTTLGRSCGLSSTLSLATAMNKSGS